MALRVLHVIAAARYGGAEAFFERLVEALAGQGIEQRVAITRNAERASRLVAHVPQPLQLRFGGAGDIHTPLSIARLIADFRPEIEIIYMARAARRMPWRWLCNDTAIRVGRFGGYYDLAPFSSCDHLVGNTPDLAASITQAGWPANRTHFLPNFIDERDAEALSRSSFDTPADVPLVLGLGRFESDKGFEILVDAMSRLPDAWLWLAGAGTGEAALRRQVASLGIEARTRFIGWQPNAAAVLKVADVMVCPSHAEALGNVVLEAWHHGCPVISTATKGPSRLIAQDETGLLVPVGDAAAMANGISRLLNDRALAARMSQAGRTEYLRNFSEAQVVARYMDFFRQITAQQAD